MGAGQQKEENKPHSLEYAYDLKKEELSEYWQNIKATNKELIEFRPSDTHGIGLFATQDIPPRQLLETCPLVAFSLDSKHRQQKQAARFFTHFVFLNETVTGEKVRVLALGKVRICVNGCVVCACGYSSYFDIQFGIRCPSRITGIRAATTQRRRCQAISCI